MIRYLIVILILLVTKDMMGQYEPAWESLDTRPTPEWWTDAKFGIFIHWGVYSVPAYAPMDKVENVYAKYAEHYMSRLLTKNELFTRHHEKYFGNNTSYHDFASQFKAEYFDADAWAELIKKSGARYVVLTSKHHDGFCLWPSKNSPNWNSMVLGPGRDLVGDLSEAVRKNDLRMGIYYSLLEWEHPLYSSRTIEKWVDTHMIPQMKELVTTYKPEIIFSDGEWDFTSDVLKSEHFLAWLYNESPVKQTVVVNDRWGNETRSKHGDYYTTEYDLVHNKIGIGDEISKPWEESRGIGTSYGYNQFETTDHYFTSEQLIHLLIDKVSNGGNLLLNIGPKANGLIPVILQERLLQIGEWLDANGEAIYGTSASPFWPREFEWGVCTEKDQTIFLHLFDTSITNLKIQGIFNEIKSVNYLATEESLKFVKLDNDLYIDLTPTKPDVDVNIIAVSLEGKIEVDKRPHQFQNNNIVIPAWAFKIHGSTTKMIFNGYDRIAHISNWTDCENHISCEFVTNKPGDYEIFVDYCSDATSSGSEAIVLINSDTINFTSENTGGWKGKNYKTKKCGIVTIEKEGEQQITVKPNCGKWKNMAIKEIIFTLK